METIMAIITALVIISVPLFEYIIDWEEEKREKAEQKKTNA